MKTTHKIVAGTIAAAVAVGGAAAANANGGTRAASARPAANAALATALDTSTESKFTPIAPCRAADTRVAGGPLGSTQSRIFAVGGTTSFATQGGTAGGCGVPVDATAAAVTITAVATGNGFMHVWPAGGAEPIASFMNYTQVFSVSTGGTVTLGSAGFVRVKVFQHSTQIVIDISGYYVKPMFAQVDAGGTLGVHSRTTRSFHLNAGSDEVSFDRDVSNCDYSATVNDFHNETIFASPSFGHPKGVLVVTKDSVTGTPTDAPFYLLVTC